MTFADRHLGPSEADQQRMLDGLGFGSLDELVAAAVPSSIRDDELDLPPAVDETAMLAELRSLADRNQPRKALIGLGYHGTITPAVIRRNVLENPAWYTAYTPYQPEISQGRLEALLAFQTVITELTGLPLANASMLDEGTAAAEGMTLAHRLVKDDARNRFVVHADTHPQTVAVIATRAEPLGLDVTVTDDVPAALADDCFAVLLSYPGSSGELHDLGPLAAAAHDSGARVVVAADPLAMCLLPSPASLGADVVVGSAQRFGVPMFFGGPHAGFLAASDDAKRLLPGRLVGTSLDRHGRPANRLALQTREQHIRRERATSNICTAQVLLANVAAFWAIHHGPEGLRAIAEEVHGKAARLAAAAIDAGMELTHDRFFDTIGIATPDPAGLVAAAADAGFSIRPGEDRVTIAFDQTVTDDDLVALAGALGCSIDGDARAAVLPEDARRSEPFLQQELFSAYRSETELMRLARRWAQYDIALDRSMIPLGSCTMKLNAAAEMEPVTWPAFANLHPFAPLDESAGSRELIAQLEDWLAVITGYDQVSVQPNAGSQGELAGLLAIRGWHLANGDTGRVTCLIPGSAHGTNAASAVMAGMEVVVVATSDNGDIDLVDLEQKAKEHQDTLAALMVTYPSTHGVFEEGITRVCEIIHEHGGQVYLDGANLNALVGLARPGRFGADVSHLNLHKTFCIPHGGGGPGVGPVAVRAHLAPFLPGHPLDPEADPDAPVGAVSAAPHGSPGVLPISWSYIRMMGADGLRRATQVALLNANHVAARLKGHYEILFTGPGGLVAHECIVDIRPLDQATGITNEDIAKRLIDYGFHAPTMSFPVPGTLMIEPTESESLRELDRFCDAMIAIRAEIDQVADGTWPADDNPLVNAPHTAIELLADEWTHPYSRERAAHPLPWVAADKYWPPVSRIQQAHGDRHLVCACPPVDAYAHAGDEHKSGG
ncbi:MAG: aminomethyl-transferring glycine dehydrogenase [Nitriliruptorales bacterium]|nr:aminomethyl-transferring glycine dehydrogenase [Nitriliruptorales bacterium]